MFRKILLGAAAFVAGTAVVAYAGPRKKCRMPSRAGRCAQL